MQSLPSKMLGRVFFRGKKTMKFSTRMLAASGFVMALSVPSMAQTVEWTAGQIGGGWYTIVSGGSKLLEEKNPGLIVKAVPGGGAANPTKVQNGQSQLGMSIDVFARAALDGVGFYEGKPKHDKLMMIGQSLGDTPYHFLRAKGQTMDMDTLFKTGTNIRFGAVKAGATDEVALRWVMAHYGHTYETLRAKGWRFINADYAELSSGFKDGQIDYLFFAQGLPGASVMDMQTGRDGELLNMPETLLADIKAKYGMGSGFIPAGTYSKFQSGPVKVLNMQTTLITSKDVPDEVVYKVTKTLCENEADLPKIHASLKDYKCATAISERPVPVHPGAMRYYREKGIAQN
jgi:TRAP transporter TAXI family solute receptor